MGDAISLARAPSASYFYRHHMDDRTGEVGSGDIKAQVDIGRDVGMVTKENIKIRNYEVAHDLATRLAAKAQKLFGKVAGMGVYNGFQSASTFSAYA